ncbi:MAG: HemK/PrmC family methyltransferase [bacterium]
MTPARRTTARALVQYALPRIDRADAEFLLMSLLEVPRHEAWSDRPVSAVVARRFRLAVAAVKRGLPPQYAVHSAPFLDLDLFVDRRVLIPRPETEGLVQRALELCPAPRLVVDFGTGSGCIAVAVARTVQDCRVVAVDSSRAALEVARLNITRHKLGRRIRLAQCQGLAAPPLRRLAGKVDLLIANPPYIPTARLARLSDRVRREPRSALDGGPKGISIVAMLLEQGRSLVRHGGLIAIEVDSTHRNAVRRVAPGARIERDLAGLTRYAFLENNP